MAKGDPGSNPDDRMFSSRDVARIAQVSLRQLQWWDERRLVSPHQEGHRRVYAAKDVIEIMVLGELRRKGFSLQKVRRVLRFLQRDLGRRLRKDVTSRSGCTLLTMANPATWKTTPAASSIC